MPRTSEGRREVPGWAWLNSFAHGELATLRETQRSTRSLASSTRITGAEKAWLQAQSIVGRDLLRIVQEDPGRLTLVQQSILVPLELQLMEFETNADLTAYDLVQATRATLQPRLHSSAKPPVQEAAPDEPRSPLSL